MLLQYIQDVTAPTSQSGIESKSKRDVFGQGLSASVDVTLHCKRTAEVQNLLDAFFFGDRHLLQNGLTMLPGVWSHIFHE